jgi:hypothetical protein
MRKFIPFALAVAFLAATSEGVSAGYIDSINPAATPSPFTSFASTVYSEGYYYTPTQSYSLTGISSFFNSDPDANSASQTLMVQIQTERPINGGVVLAQGSFSGVPTIGGILGATFATPVTLTAGTTYFVDFLNIEGMGINLGQYTVDGSGNHIASAGATIRLPVAYVGKPGDLFPDSDARVGNAADENPGNGPASYLEPIIDFSGSPLASVPEPASVLMLGMGFTCTVFCARRLVTVRETKQIS